MIDINSYFSPATIIFPDAVGMSLGPKIRILGRQLKSVFAGSPRSDNDTAGRPPAKHTYSVLLISMIPSFLGRHVAKIEIAYSCP
jgi:hypothetical protein